MHGTIELVNRFKTISKQEFWHNMAMDNSYNMIYLKAPIGSDQFVASWLRKLLKLEEIISAISVMPYKHEAFTLLRSCVAECRVMYLMRVLPPCQLGNFMKSYDKGLKKGFEGLLGIKSEEKWWGLAQLPSKYGGMAMQSGLRTLGAQHLSSFAKAADYVERIVGNWDVIAHAKLETQDWLTNACEQKVDIEYLVSRLRTGEDKEDHGVRGSNYQYSIANCAS